MSTTKHLLTPPQNHVVDAATPGTKRKRSESLSQPDAALSTHHQAHSAYLDILEILQRHDPTPSVLLHLLDGAQTSATSDAPAPAPKRTKLAEDASAATAATIADKIQQAVYRSLEELENDTARACAALIAPIKSKERGVNGAYVRPSLDEVQTMQRVLAFEQLARRLFSRQRLSDKSQEQHAAGPHHAANGVKPEPSSPAKITAANSGRTVLTLFGNAPTPKQLFSSLQIAPSGDAVPTNLDLSLEELGLPNMLTATKLLPHQATTFAVSTRQQPTFGDVFAPSASVAQLQPPKTSRHPSNRRNSISFLPGETLPKPARKSGFPAQPLAVGNWIGYGGPLTSKEPSSPAAKRKQRDRALSTVDSTRPSQEELVSEAASQEDALFRAAFSSFAPTSDNAKALISDDSKNMVWWHKIGQQRYDHHFVLDPALEELVTLDLVEAANPDDITKSLESLDDFEEEYFKTGVPVFSDTTEGRSPEQLLKAISELLETLSSHQRIRHSSLATIGRTPASPSPMISAMFGRPSSPSVEETDTYRSLRAQLAELIAQLPPYAVAKLDGEQLEDLCISKSILMEGKSYRGSMEDDQLTRMAKSAALTAAAGSTARPIPGTAYAAPSQYGRTPSGPQTATRPAHTPGTSYYGNARPPAGGYQRNTSYGTPSGTAPRQSYSQLAAYNNQTSRPQATYGQNSNTQYYQKPTYPPQYGQGSPQPQSQVRTNHTSSAPAYQNRTPGPQIPYVQRPPSTVNGQQAGSGRSTPVQTSQVGPSGFHTSMTTEQQQLMMERQRAQLAAQPQARMAAQVDMSRQESGTPQPAPTNGVAGEGAEQARPMVA